MIGRDQSLWEPPYPQPGAHTPTAATVSYQPSGHLPRCAQPYGAAPREHPQGTTILIFGIIGIFVTIFAPIAWYMGSKAKKEIQASGVQYSNEPNVNAGRVLGMVFTIIWLAFIGIMIVMMFVPAFLVMLAALGSGVS
jgi:ABC-type Fe3+ transport system permease subunit